MAPGNQAARERGTRRKHNPQSFQRGGLSQSDCIDSSGRFDSRTFFEALACFGRILHAGCAAALAPGTAPIADNASTTGQESSGVRLRPIRGSMATAKNYFDLARGPTASLYFVVPLLLLYVCGVLVLSDTTTDNVTEIWPHVVSTTLGVGAWLVLPGVTIAGLIVWSKRAKARWNVPAYVVAGMWAECLAVAAVWIAIAHGSFVEVPNLSGGAAESAIATAAPNTLRQWKIGVGVEEVLIVVQEGISDDVLFRLLMFPFFAILIRWLGQSRTVAVFGAVAASTLVAVAMNYFGWHVGASSSFNWLGCAIHTALLGLLFAYRGFGVTVGTHIIYLVWAGLVLSV